MRPSQTSRSTRVVSSIAASQTSQPCSCAFHDESGLISFSPCSTISGTIKNLTDGPLEIDVDPAFYLSSRTCHKVLSYYGASKSKA
jgi:hypothetical protein